MRAVAEVSMNAAVDARIGKSADREVALLTGAAPEAIIPMDQRPVMH
jgi:hypothetical protein